jgi:hypothetical protein
MSSTILISRGQRELSAAKLSRVSSTGSNMNRLLWHLHQKMRIPLIIYVVLKHNIHITKILTVGSQPLMVLRKYRF